MLWLANAVSAEELTAWDGWNARNAPGVKTGGYTTEVKIEGLRIE